MEKYTHRQNRSVRICSSFPLQISQASRTSGLRDQFSWRNPSQLPIFSFMSDYDIKTVWTGQDMIRSSV